MFQFLGGQHVFSTNWRRIAIAVIGVAILGLLVVAFGFSEKLSPSRQQITASGIAGIALTIVGLAITLVYNARRGNNDAADGLTLSQSEEIPSRNDADLYRFLRSLRSQIMLFDKRLSLQQASYDKLEAEIQGQISSKIDGLTSDVIISRASEALQQRIDAVYNAEVLERTFADMTMRLEYQARSTALVGQYSLAIGAMISAAGITMLAYFLGNSKEQFNDTVVFAVHYIPRLGLVILIEALSLFFLNQYKRSIDEAKFYSNEVTNVQARLIAVQLGKQSDDPSVVSRIIETIVGTERNFVLEKGQSTIEIERERLAGTNKVLENMLQLKEFVKAVKG